MFHFMDLCLLLRHAFTPTAPAIAPTIVSEVLVIRINDLEDG
jgi:hypothetical protein